MAASESSKLAAEVEAAEIIITNYNSPLTQGMIQMVIAKLPTSRFGQEEH
jgi:hypothetical protein